MKSIFKVIFKKEITEWENNISQNISEITSLRKDIQKLKENEKSISKTIDHKNKTLNILEEKIHQYRQTKASLEHTLTSQTKIIENLKEENLKLSTSEKSLKSQVETQINIVVSTREELRSIRLSENSLAITNRNLHKKIADIEKEISQLKESEKILKQSLDCRDETIAGLETEVLKLMEAGEVLKSNLNSKNESIAKKEEKISDLIRLEKSLREIINSQVSKISEIDIELRQVKDSKRNLNKTIDAQLATIALNEEKINQLKEANNSLSESLRNKDFNIEENDMKIAQLKETVRSLNETLHNHIATIAKKDEEIYQQNKAGNITQEILVSKINIIAKNEEEINQLKGEILTLRRLLDSKIQTIANKNKEINQLSNSEIFLTQTVESKVNIISELEVQLRKKSEEEQNFIQMIDEKENEIKTLTKDLEEFQDLNNTQANVCDELLSQIDDLKTIVSEKDSIIKELELKIKQLEANNVVSETTQKKCNRSVSDAKPTTSNNSEEEKDNNICVDNKSYNVSEENKKDDFESPVEKEASNLNETENFSPGDSAVSDGHSKDNSDSSFSTSRKKTTKSDTGKNDTTQDSPQKDRLLHYPYRRKPTIDIFKLQEKNFPSIENENVHFYTSRTIDYVFNHRTNSIVTAEEIFLKKSAEEISKIRMDLEEANHTGIPYLTCPCCENFVKISVRNSGYGEDRREVQFFTHAVKNIHCDLKRTSYDPEIPYGDFQLYESQSLKDMRRKISEALRMERSKVKGVSDVRENYYVVSDEIPQMKRRLADVTAKFKDIDLVFEIVTPITNIAKFQDRDNFYFLNRKQVFWIFGLESTSDYTELTRAVSKDILYSYKRNVFVFDSEAQLLSERIGELILKCNWLDADGEWHYQVNKQGKNGILISLDKITFDPDTCHPYYFDADAEYYSLHPEKSKPLILGRKELRGHIVESYDYELRRKEAINEMERKNESVQAYFNGFKWGFKYGDVIFIEPIFDSVPQICGMYAKVEKNHKFGVVDRYGNIQLQPEYERINLLPNGRILYPAKGNWHIYGIIEPLTEYYPQDFINFIPISKEESVYYLSISHKIISGLSLEKFYFIDSKILKKNLTSGKWFLWQTEIDYHAVLDEFTLTPERYFKKKNCDVIRLLNNEGEKAFDNLFSNSKNISSYNMSSKRGKANRNASINDRDTSKDDAKNFKLGVTYRVTIISIKRNPNNLIDYIEVYRKGVGKLKIFGDALNKRLDIFYTIWINRNIKVRKYGYDPITKRSKFELIL